ncbi:MAG TPA: RDD family protein, partial [Chlamydiales bacterium]|nr:RDD family protein [Chlamydiales bacterium]
MSYFKRLLAKFFDYALLYSVLYLIGSKLDIVRNNVLITALVLIVPILWVMFETLFLKIFGTTPGKALLGIRLKEKLSLKKSFIRSLCSLCPLFIFKKVEPDFVYKNCGISRLIVSVLMITAFTTSSIIWDQMHPRSTATFSMHTEEYTDWTP